MPEWQTVGESGDLGTLLLDLYSYVGDVMHYYIDRVGAEAFLSTAVRRQSVMYIADMLGYSPMGQRSASVPVKFHWEYNTENYPQGLPEYTYSIVQASATNGVVCLGLAGTSAVKIIAGQTVTVKGLSDAHGANIPEDSKFIVDKVTEPTDDSPFLIYFNIPSTSPWAYPYEYESSTVVLPASTVSSGMSVIIPAKTKVKAPNNGDPVVFEIDRDILLDMSASQEDVSASTRYVDAVATAFEGISVEKTRIGTSQGIPNAEFTIPNEGVIDRTVRVYTLEGGQAVEWSRVDKMSLASPTQSVFTVYVDDQNYTHILFGDNSSGRIAPSGVEIYVEYRYGVGSAANGLGIDSITELGSSYASSLGVTVTNTASPVGGVDVESIASMRYSVPRSASLKQRAVTLDDFVSLALQVPGVTKAVAYGSNYSTIYVRIATGPQSQAYSTYTVSGKYVTTDTITLTLDSASGISTPGQLVYIDNVFASDFSTRTVNVFQNTTPVKIDSIEVTSAVSGPDTIKVTTVSSHGISVGQPIRITGLTGVTSVLNSTHVVTSATATSVTFSATSSLGSGTTSVSDQQAFTSRQNGFTITNTSLGYTPTSEWVAVSSSPTPTVTTVDPSMQLVINSLEQYLEDKKLIGSVVYGEPVEWTNVDLNVFVSVRPLYNREAVRFAVQDAIEQVFKYDNVEFGKRISIGDVYRAGLGVEGVSYITVNKLIETGSTDGVRDINVFGEPENEFSNDENAFRIPRINPAIALPWVTASGGLANT
jgi:hypothetical protein